jgi:GT2 family glycosyltransferase
MTPQFSIVVPTCGRPERLLELLESVRAACDQSPALRCEVIVSDDGERDPAGERVRRHFPEVRFLDGPRRGPAANRNHGARHAIGEWLVFVDDDCQPADSWLHELGEEVAGRSLDVIEGKIVAPHKRDSIFLRHVENLAGDCFWSANLAIRRDVFEQIGGFDEDFTEAGGEDLELAHRIRSNGLRTIFCPSAVVYHPSHVMTWAALLEHAFRIRWHVLYQLKTGGTLPVAAAIWLAIPYAACTRFLDLLRTTVGWLRRRTTHAPQTLGAVLLGWTVFPLILPYLLYWEVRFRCMLNNRVTAAAPAIQTPDNPTSVQESALSVD